MDTKISVIIPTYKPDTYLWQCLQSLQNQTISKEFFEIIIILNGCRDPWKEQISTFIKELLYDLNVRLFQIDVAGVSNARNLGITESIGEFITFLDDDDFVSPKYLEELFNKASIDTVSLCYPLSFIDGTNDYSPYRITETYDRNYKNNNLTINDVRRYFSGPVYKLIHRSIIAENRYDVRLHNGEDTLFMFSISNRINKLSFTSKDAIYYRRVREGSAVNKKRSLQNVIKSGFVQIMEYTKIYFKHPFQYNLYFYLTRVVGTLVGILRN